MAAKARNPSVKLTFLVCLAIFAPLATAHLAAAAVPAEELPFAGQKFSFFRCISFISDATKCLRDVFKKAIAPHPSCCEAIAKLNDCSSTLLKGIPSDEFTLIKEICALFSSASPMAAMNPSGNVQLVASKGEVPERYIHKECDRGAEDVPLMACPVIDISLLASSSTDGQELDKLRHGLQSWGCFQAINHGMSPEFLEEVRQLAKQFFALSMEDKQRYSREADGFEGYGNDMVLSDHQILDWTDRLYLTVYPEDSCNFKYWPKNPERFREVLHEYTTNIRVTSEAILKAMARSLNLDENSFLNQYGEQIKLDARFNFYPQCPKPDLVLGVKPHADGSAITILLQDKEVEGLQFLKDNEWFKAPIIPDALLVNVGDQAEITSNGIFKSPVHRVMTNSVRERISLAVFYLPDVEKDIEPLDKLISESQPKLYKTVKNFVGLYFQYYQHGQRPIEAARI